MNDSLSVSASNLSKRYMLYEKPRDRLKHSFFRHFGKTYGHEFWALHNISFELHKGETLGVIGRNGSGKSTLLQIIAGTLTSTVGEVKVNGRVAALLELGSGFNPEYTGRENIFMNGAILGIPRREMEGKVNEIISFADIGEFIDQPVKSYSSGMFVRLAFAVTTGLDAEVLLIDEALAVGDIFFRQKCYQRLEKLRQGGCSIILVSHAMNEIEQFCRRALLLHKGRLVALGISPQVVKRYYLIQHGEHLRELNEDLTPPEIPSEPFPITQEADSFFWPEAKAFLSLSEVLQVSPGGALCLGIALCDDQGLPRKAFSQGERAFFYYEFELRQGVEVPIGGIVLQNEKGIIVHGKNTLQYTTEIPGSLPPGTRLRFRQEISLELATGEYTFEIGLAAIAHRDFEKRKILPHENLAARIFPLCHLSALGPFAVLARQNGEPIQLLHYGVANLPGNCRVKVVLPLTQPSASLTRQNDP